MENINLDIIPKDGERILKELADGHMVIARSKNDFLYILDFGGEFHLFSHTPGAPGGGQQKFPKDEKYTASVRKIADMSDSVYMAQFDKSLNLYGVMATAEEGILSMFPGEGMPGEIEFVVPDSGKQDQGGQE